MSNILQQLQSQGQGFAMERGNEVIAQGEEHKKYLQQLQNYNVRKSAQDLARSQISKQFGNTALQTAEQIAPVVYKAGKAVAKRTGIDDYLSQKQQNAKEWTTSTRGQISDYLDSKTPDFIKQFTQKRAEPKQEQDDAEPSVEEPSVAQPKADTEKFINDATYASIRSRVSALTPQGQDVFEKGMNEIGKGQPHPIDFDTGEIDPEKLARTADLYVDTFNQFGGRGLVGGGRGFSSFMREKLGLDPLPQKQDAIDSRYTPPQENVEKFYAEQDVRPTLRPGETGNQYLGRISSAGSLRNVYNTASNQSGYLNELENPIDPPQQPNTRGELDEDKRPGGVVERGYQSLAIPTEEAHLAEVKRINDEASIRANPYGTVPQEALSSMRGGAKPAQAPVDTSPDIAPGYKVLGDALGLRGQLQQARGGLRSVEDANKRYADAPWKRTIDETVAQGQIGNPYRRGDLLPSGRPVPPPPSARPDIPPPPKEQQQQQPAEEPKPAEEQKVEPRDNTRGVSGMGTKEPAIAQQPSQPVRDYSQERGGGANDPRESDLQQSGGRGGVLESNKQQQQIDSNKGAGDGGEGGGGMLGRYGLETLTGIGVAGELANPLSSAKQKATQVGETVGAYAGMKAGGYALESAGMKAGMGEVMTGVEVAQDLFNKNMNTGQKAVGVAKAVGTYGGAMAAEALVPGLGEVAMLATGLGELFHGLHKEHEQEQAQKAQEQARPLGVQPQQQAPHQTVAFDSAPVIDSSNYHNM